MKTKQVKVSQRHIPVRVGSGSRSGYARIVSGPYQTSWWALEAAYRRLRVRSGSVEVQGDVRIVPGLQLTSWWALEAA